MATCAYRTSSECTPSRCCRYSSLLLEIASRRVVGLRSPRVRAGFVWTVAVGYVLMLALLTWQALRGQSIVQPDFITLLAAAGIVAVVVAGFGISWTRRNSGGPVTQSPVAQSTDAHEQTTSLAGSVRTGASRTSPTNARCQRIPNSSRSWERRHIAPAGVRVPSCSAFLEARIPPQLQKRGFGRAAATVAPSAGCS